MLKLELEAWSSIASKTRRVKIKGPRKREREREKEKERRKNFLRTQNA